MRTWNWAPKQKLIASSLNCQQHQTQLQQLQGLNPSTPPQPLGHTPGRAGSNLILSRLQALHGKTRCSSHSGPKLKHRLLSTHHTGASGSLTIGTVTELGDWPKVLPSLGMLEFEQKSLKAWTPGQGRSLCRSENGPLRLQDTEMYINVT